MKKNGVMVLLVLVSVVALWFISGLIGKRRQKAPVFVKVDLGQVLGEETVRLLGGRGRVIVLCRDSLETPAVQGTLNSFAKIIGKQPGMVVASTRQLKFAEMSSMCRMPSAVYLDLIGQSPPANAIVSFIGAPELTDAELSQLDLGLPKLLVVSPCNADFKSLFDAGVLHLVVTPRRQLPPPNAKKPKTPRGWFDLSYEIITPQTVGATVP